MLRRFGLPTGFRLWLRAAVLTLVLNAVFIALSFSSNLVPQEMLAERIRQAFATGELIERDYLPYDTHRGFHQYNDCNILQMITNPDSSATGRALGPWIHIGNSLDTDANITLMIDACTTLRELVVNGQDPATLISLRYTRYWHGYIPVISALLTFLDISAVRAVLRASVYTSVLLLFLAGVRRRFFLPLTAAVATACTFFWGLLYFGQGLSHALGDTSVILGITCLVFWHREFARLGTLISFCASFGAVVVYFEMLTGPLPTAAGLLFPTVYLISRLNNRLNAQTGQHFRYATAALVAFGLGAALTVGARIVIAATLVKPSGLDAFSGHLGFYTQAVDKGYPIPAFLQPFGRLVRRGEFLAYGSKFGLIALYMSAMGAYLTSMWLARKQGGRLAWADLAAFAVGAGSIPVWTFILPVHTFIHAGFMSRILIVPISLGWAALLWQLCLQRGSQSLEY